MSTPQTTRLAPLDLVLGETGAPGARREPLRGAHSPAPGVELGERERRDALALLLEESRG
jgi:hypothetical protein